jgi:hypothetical protein
MNRLCRCLVLLGFALYMTAVVALYIQFHSDFVWLSLMILLNVATLLFVGNYLLRSVLFPYSNFFIRKQLDSVINRRFSQEFGRLLQQVHKCLRILAEVDGMETFAEFKKLQADLEEQGAKKAAAKMKILMDDSVKSMEVTTGASQGSNVVSGPISEGGKELSYRDKKRITLEINQKMLAVLELIMLYSEVNQEIMDKHLHPISVQFANATQELKEIRAKLESLPLISTYKENPRFKNVWNFYRKDLIDDGQEHSKDDSPIAQRDGVFTILPKIAKTSQNLAVIAEIGELANEFVVNVETATRTRCCFFCRFTKMFGTIE